MRPISSLSMLALGFFSSWQMLLFWAAVYILISGYRDKQRINLILRNALMILLCFVNYTLFQCTVGYTSQNAVTDRMIRIVEQYAKLPALGLIAVCALLTIVEVYLIGSIRRWYNAHITSASIKEAIETLPVGICAYEDSGKITLKNNAMEQLCRSLTGYALLNGSEFAQTLTEEQPDLAAFTVELPDQTVWSFTKERIRDKKNYFTLLIAYNVTEEYQKTRMLAEKRETVQALNEKLTEYNKRIESVITAQEILNAKVRIHDELGGGLLAIRRYLTSGGTETDRRALLEQLSQNVQFLQHEAVSDTQDEYTLMLTTAEALGVTVQIRGTLPQTEPNRHILAAAIHECFTNILRHTDGNTLYLSVTEDAQTVTAQFTDNSTQPIESIAETGGLGSLRALTERAGGAMRIAAAPRYCLTITLPKEHDQHGL